MVLVIILSVAAPLCLVVVILGCLNCFMKRKPGFAPFSNPGCVEEGTAGRHNDAFSVDMEPTTTSNETQIVIDPIPDITAKSVSLPPLRPKIVCVDKENQNSSLSFFSSHRPFPRENLTYINPLGVGWFGQVILTEALRISTGTMRSQVVVKMLKDDASSVEERQFIEEIFPFRHLDHPNVISLLGQCTEARPYLYIVEYAPHGNLKTFLQSHKQSMGALLKKNKLLHFCLDAAAGVACIHRHNFVHCDLSTRNCLVTADYTIKIGDYGIAEQTFKEDYFQSGNELLPIRWMAPECLTVKEGDSHWSAHSYSKASDMWSFGVLLWEMFSMAEQPYDMLTNEAVLQGVVIDKVVSLADIPLQVPFHDRLSGLMGECWKDPAERITIEPAHQVLDEMSKEKVQQVAADEMDFDQKWNHLIPNTQSRSQSLASEDGSAIALAGSFSSETPFTRDDRVSPSLSQIDSVIPTKEISMEDSVKPSRNVSHNKPLVVKKESKLQDDNQTTNLKDEKVEVKPSVPSSITPSKKQPQQMMTSTPLADKSAQNNTSTSPNTPSSQYVTAQEASAVNNSVLELESGGSNSTQEFDSLSTSEWNKTIQAPKIGAVESSLNVTPDQNGLADVNSSAALNFVGSLPQEEILAPKNETATAVLFKEDSLSQNDNNAFGDFVDFSTDANKGEDIDTSKNDDFGSLVGVEIETETNQPKELDTSFDIIVPSMLSEDKNVEATSEQSPTSSPSSTSQNASLNLLGDFDNSKAEAALTTTENENNESLPQADDINILAGFSEEGQTSALSDIMMQTDPAIESNKSTQDVNTDSILSFENNNTSPSSSSPNPFNSSNTNPFSLGETTTSSSSQDAAIFFNNKSGIDASSSLNSSSLLGGWDTSFPEGGVSEATVQTTDATNDFAQMNLSQTSDNALSFGENTEGPKGESSPVSSTDFSFVEIPDVSDFNAGQKSPDTMSESTAGTDSLLAGFELPSPSSMQADQVPSNPIPHVEDDLFGLASPSTQPDQFLVDNSTNSKLVPDQESSTPSNSDPFDFSAFEIPTATTTTEQQKPQEIDIFSTGFDEIVKVNNNQEEKNKNATPSLSSDSAGVDLFSGESTAAMPDSNTGTTAADLMQEVAAETKVGTTTTTTTTATVYKSCDSDSFPDHSEDESGVVVNSCRSLTESNSTIPTSSAAAATAASDSCYVSGITESKSFDGMTTSEEISSSREFFVDTASDNVKECDDSSHHSDSTEVEESLSSNNDLDNKELFLDLKENSDDAKSTSSDDSEYKHSSDDTSSTSGSEREYICVNPFDTGQPPTTFDPDYDNNKENLDPDHIDKDLSFEDMSEKDLKIVSEIYLSRGVKSPRVFEVPTLETIPEHQPIHCVSSPSEEAVPTTPSETSSVGPRDDELFGSDSYEWDDDFYGDSLIGKDDTGLEMEDDILPHAQSSIAGEQNNISNWSLDFEADNSQFSSNASSSVLSTTIVSNRSDSACTTTGKDNNKSSISDQNVRCLSDSELLVSKNSTSTSSRPSLVASTLAKHRSRSRQFSSPLKSSSRDNGNFYSLMEDFDDFQLDSSQEDNTSPVQSSDNEGSDDIHAVDKLTYPSLHSSHHAELSSLSPSYSSPSSSVQLSSSSLHPSSLHSSHLSPKKSPEVLAVDQDATMRTTQVSSTPDVNSTSSPSMDLLGLGFDPISPSKDTTNTSSIDQDLGNTAGSSQDVTTSVATNSDPFDSLI